MVASRHALWRFAFACRNLAPLGFALLRQQVLIHLSVLVRVAAACVPTSPHRSALLLKACLALTALLPLTVTAQERCTYHAPTSSGHGDIVDFSADAVCRRIFERTFPAYVNGGNYIARGTYLGTFYQGNFGGIHGWLCQFDRTTTRISDGAILQSETGPIMLEGATSRCHQALKISLSGPDRTKALPAGPALPHLARVTENDAPAPGKSVTISLGSGGVLSGGTDANGEFRFMYVPPRQQAVIEQITGSCGGCSNTATKQVSVDACESCDGEGR